MNKKGLVILFGIGIIIGLLSFFYFGTQLNGFMIAVSIIFLLVYSFIMLYFIQKK